MIITRTSSFTGKVNTMDLPCSERAINAWKTSGQYIQDALPQLNADQREFLMTGVTPEEWDEFMGPDPDEEEE